MKTTIDLPEDLLHRAKVVAAKHRMTLKELVVKGLEHATSHPLDGPEERDRRARAERLLAALQGNNGESIKPFSREQLYGRGAGRSK